MAASVSCLPIVARPELFGTLLAVQYRHIRRTNFRVGQASEDAVLRQYPFVPISASMRSPTPTSTENAASFAAGCARSTTTGFALAPSTSP